MQKKKLLSVCLTVLLLCICMVGVFALSVDAATPVTWKVTGTANPAAGEYATLQAAIDAAAAKTDWLGTDELTIEITTATKQTFDYKNGLLFEVNTIFTQANTKLPIIIKGGEIDAAATFPNQGSTSNRRPMACTNDYTFKDMTFLLGERYVDFYAGSGEVVFDNVVVYAGSNHRVYFYGDNCTADAFANWTEANVAAEKGEDGLIPVSLTFKNTDYASVAKARFAAMNADEDFAAAGDLVSADDLHVSFTIQDSAFGTGYLRLLNGADGGTAALSPVGKLTFNMIDTSADKISNASVVQLHPIGNASAAKADVVTAPDFDAEINIDGGTISKSPTFLYGAKFKGDVEINISGGKFPSEVNVSNGEGLTAVEGNVVLNVSGGTFTTLRGSYVAGLNLEEDHGYRNVANITGGTIETFQGSRQCPGEYGSLIHYVSGDAEITNFWGAYVSASAGGGNYGYIENNVSGGTITNFYGGGQLKSGYATDIVNNISGGTIGAYVGAGNADVKGTITNNLSGGTITGKFVGTTDGLSGRQDETMNIVRNNFTGGTVGGALCCTGSRPNKEVYNNFDGTKAAGAYYGNYGTADYVENRFVSGEIAGQVNGTTATTKDVVNYLIGGNYACGTTRVFFYGTKGTTTGTVTNYIEGEFTCDNGKKNANTYLTGGNSKTIVNHFRSAKFVATVYANDGNFDTITNHYYGTYVATAGHHGGAGSSNVIPANGSEQRLITNNFYPGAQLGTFYGCDGKQDNKVGTAKIVNNIDGATFSNFYGGLFRGAALEIENNVTGDATFGAFNGGNSLGLIISGSNVPAIITPTITNNIESGTFNNYYGGNASSYRDYSNDTIINNINGGTFSGTIRMGSDSPASDVQGTVTDWRDLSIDTTINGGTFTTRVFGTGGSCQTVTNTLNDGEFRRAFTGTNGAVDTVTNYIRGGAYDLSGDPRDYFYGSGGTSNKVVNYVDGNATFADNCYLSNGTSKLVENHFYSIGDHSNLYGSQGVTELTRNYFYDGFVMYAATRGSRGSDTAIPEGQKREIENYFYGGNFTAGTFMGADGGQKAFPTTTKITNYVMGGEFATLTAGGGRGDAYEIDTIFIGDATVKTFYGGSSTRFDDGVEDTHLNPVYNTTVGTETDPFTGHIESFYGGNSQDNTLDIYANITNTVNSGSIGNFIGGSAQGIDGSVTNIFNGGVVAGDLYGGAKDANLGGSASVEGAVNTTINGGTYFGSVSSVEDQPVKLSGIIGIGANTQIIATEASNVTLNQTEQWVSGHQYLIIPDSFIGEVTTTNQDPTVDGMGFVDPATGAITGFSVAKGSIMASLDLQERVVLKLWFPKADVDVYLESVGQPFQYNVTLDEVGNILTLANGSISAPRKADMVYSAGGKTVEYYVVSLSGIGAGNFDKTITVSGSAFVFTNSVMNLAETGAQAYKGQAFEPLFQAIYDYGAAASGRMTKYDFLPYTTDLAASVIGKADNNVINITAFDALMGDAVGIRFIGTPGSAYNASSLVVKLDGVALQNGVDYRIVESGSEVYIDIFFKAAFMFTDMTLTVEAEGVQAVSLATSVERAVADIVRYAPKNQKAIALLVYIQQVKAYLG